MITYNHEKYIAEAIEGVVKQIVDFPIELVIGDDCSTDNTRTICRAYQQSYPEIIRMLERETNLGIMPNFVNALRECRGTYIALCEGDDAWLDQNKLAKQIKFLESNPVYSGVCSNVEKRDERRSTVIPDPVLSALPSELDISTRDLLKNFYAYTATFVFRNWGIDFTPLSKYSFGDKLIQLRVSQRGKIKFFNHVTAMYRIHWLGAMHTVAPANPYRFHKDYSDFLTLFDRDTDYEFHREIDDLQKYIASILKLCNPSTSLGGKLVAGAKYLSNRKTAKSPDEFRNVVTLAFPAFRKRMKRLFGVGNTLG